MSMRQRQTAELLAASRKENNANKKSSDAALAGEISKTGAVTDQLQVSFLGLDYSSKLLQVESSKWGEYAELITGLQQASLDVIAHWQTRPPRHSEGDAVSNSLQVRAGELQNIVSEVGPFIQSMQEQLQAVERMKAIAGPEIESKTRGLQVDKAAAAQMGGKRGASQGSTMQEGEWSQHAEQLMSSVQECLEVSRAAREPGPTMLQRFVEIENGTFHNLEGTLHQKLKEWAEMTVQIITEIGVLQTEIKQLTSLITQVETELQVLWQSFQRATGKLVTRGGRPAMERKADLAEASLNAEARQLQASIQQLEQHLGEMEEERRQKLEAVRVLEEELQDARCAQAVDGHCREMLFDNAKLRSSLEKLQVLLLTPPAASEQPTWKQYVIGAPGTMPVPSATAASPNINTHSDAYKPGTPGYTPGYASRGNTVPVRYMSSPHIK